MHIGELFSMFRKERGITLKEATGNQFSTSMLSRFENGQTDISAEKLFQALDNIYLDPEEFLHLLRGFHMSDFQRFQMQVNRYRDNKDMDALLRLQEEEAQAITKDGKKQYHRLNQLVISTILDEDFGKKMPRAELKEVEDYLFKNGIWGQYELYIFVRSINLFPSDLMVTYCRELLHRMDFLDKHYNNRLLMHSIFLTALFISIERRRFSDAQYFEKQINQYFDDDRELYLRIVLKLAQATLEYCQGGTEAKQEIDDLIETLIKLDASDFAQYYRREIDKILENCK
ncbi:helix-turn-helix domain-containing protein [Streptococcus sp. S784/96/1]|uniref:helix-turn-helix domain-containing protein n=1 Tax=Streptococcus sp. S784/96/1 TaxID=2653499 RepID=UPI00138944E3|nr:Rgg/GadR/MutR family transcriptional regulator [Streptococcus sp. S784/96/1]